MLLLYQRLMNGETIYKPTFCIEADVKERTFDRYIKDIRLFLSESFSWLELEYDRKSKGYRLMNLLLKPEMGLGECFLLLKLLIDSRALRADDQEAVANILLSQLSPDLRERARTVLRRTPKISHGLTKSSVKLVEDLLFSIEHGDQITLHFAESRQEVDCIPYSIEFRTREVYLIAWELKTEKAMLYQLADIQFYSASQTQRFLTLSEQKKLRALAAMVCNEDFSTYQPYIYTKGANQ